MISVAGSNRLKGGQDSGRQAILATKQAPFTQPHVHVHIGGMNEFYSCVYYFYNERLTYLNEIIPYKNLRIFE
jgi:hypothetical protein